MMACFHFKGFEKKPKFLELQPSTLRLEKVTKRSATKTMQHKCLGLNFF